MCQGLFWALGIQQWIKHRPCPKSLYIRGMGTMNKHMIIKGQIVISDMKKRKQSNCTENGHEKPVWRADIWAWFWMKWGFSLIFLFIKENIWAVSKMTKFRVGSKNRYQSWEIWEIPSGYSKKSPWTWRLSTESQLNDPRDERRLRGTMVKIYNFNDGYEHDEWGGSVGWYIEF